MTILQEYPFLVLAALLFVIGALLVWSIHTSGKSCKHFGGESHRWRIDGDKAHCLDCDVAAAPEVKP